jgi:hypothetical protein
MRGTQGLSCDSATNLSLASESLVFNKLEALDSNPRRTETHIYIYLALHILSYQIEIDYFKIGHDHFTKHSHIS